MMMMMLMLMTFAACARAFYVAGCKLVLCARTVQELQPVKAELEKLSVVRNSQLMSLMSFIKYSVA